MALLAKAETWSRKTKLTRRVSRGRHVRGFKLKIRKLDDQGNQAWKAGDTVQAGMSWAEAGSYYATLLEVFSQ